MNPELRATPPQNETARDRAADDRSRDFGAGTAIEVRGRFRGEWSRGFEIADETREGYWVRRMPDRYVLPIEFSGRDSRRDLRRLT